jgi:translation initiation factor IF-3
LGRNVLEEVLEKLEDTFILDSPPKMEGRFMNMMLSPTGKKKKGN